MFPIFSNIFFLLKGNSFYLIAIFYCSKQGSLEELFIAPAKTVSSDGSQSANINKNVEFLAGSFSKTAQVNGVIENTESIKEDLLAEKEHFKYVKKIIQKLVLPTTKAATILFTS